MKRINVLSPGFTSPNGAAFLFPLLRFYHALKERGMDIRITDKADDSVTDCDVLMVDSKFFKHHWARDFDATIEKIAELAGHTNLVWCDQADSSGTFLGQVVPHVHKYLKAQVLKDRAAYMKTHYASRIFADFYHRENGVTDEEDFINQPVKNRGDLDKLGVSWNSAFMNYGVWGPYLPGLYSRLAFRSILRFSNARRNASASRAIDVSCRMGISYSRDTICFQRREIKKMLSRYLQTSKLSRAQYLQELDNSKVCVSPFGLGEITLKDFECFLSGSMLLKPDMSHMDTWPHFYQDGETCLFHDWDLHNLEEKIDWALSNETRRIEMAEGGQQSYLRYTTSNDAGTLFASHLSEVTHFD